MSESISSLREEVSIQRELLCHLAGRAMLAHGTGDADSFDYASSVYDETQARIYELEHKRAQAMLVNIDKIIGNPVVKTALEKSGGTKGIGWGLKEYRAGEGLLSDTPNREGEAPAEISYYPVVPAIGVNGAIYFHGPKSHALDLGELASFHFTDVVQDGSYVDHLEIRLEGDQLHIGRPAPGPRGNDGRRELLPASEETLRHAEDSLTNLADYIQGQGTLAKQPLIL